MNEQQKTALVTGAGSGIGRGIALELAAAGYDVAVHCCGSVSGAAETAERIRATGVQCEVIRADLSSAEGVDTLFDAFSARFGRLDLFVANAGVTKTGSILSFDSADFDLIASVDLKGTYFCIQRAAAIMKPQGGGSIVVISSNNAHMNTPNASAYASVKAGLSHLARHAAVELAHAKIRVNTISPGWTDTGSPRMPAPETTYYKIPLKRWVRPSEIGKAVLFLDSPFAASITGAEIVMDGGASLMSDLPERYGL